MEMADLPVEAVDTEEILLIDRLAHDLSPAFADPSEAESFRRLVGVEVARLRQAPVQDFVPILVERRLRQLPHAGGS